MIMDVIILHGVVTNSTIIFNLDLMQGVLICEMKRLVHKITSTINYSKKSVV
ncbi:hypothetical protein D3C76_1033120 [compost metagenome]